MVFLGLAILTNPLLLQLGKHIMCLLRKANRTWYLTTTSFFDWMPVIKRDFQGTEIWWFNLYLVTDWKVKNENPHKDGTYSSK